VISRNTSYSKTIKLGMLIVLLAACFLLADAVLVLDDPLQGSTSGVRDGGQFISGGWQVTGDYDSIFWHLPYSVSTGAAEFYVTGVGPSYPHKTEHFHMYDYTWYDADYQYVPGYRDDPYKHFVRKTGADDAGRNNSCEILWQIEGEYFESDTAILSWSAAASYKFRLEWGPDGDNSRLKVYRDSTLILNQAIAGSWTPAGHSVRIGCSTRRAGEGSEIGAKYSYVKVWDLSGSLGAPTVTLPVSGWTVYTQTPLIQWTGESHTHYQVRVNTADSPDSGIIWDSGQVASTASSTYSGTLTDLSNYYVFVRLANAQGWGNWSTSGHWFRVDTSSVTPNGGRVDVYGNCLQDDGGPFLGLGFTYMRSLQRCKYDRARWLSDIAAMAGKGFNYQRILSMVGWTGLEIAPISFTNSQGTYIPAWDDYWQQFRDCIDIAYDTYGLRTEITIFADAQYCMPNSSDRYTHMDNVLANLAGREHKVIQIEVANEGWQNGFPDESITRSFADYLADRTNIPVSITSPVDTSNSGIQAMYGASAADIATVHFSRDISTSEGGWLPVRDCWRVADLYPGVPPVSNNEPIGAGSSVSSENDPIKLCSAAVFSWIANLPMYVYHSRAGVLGDVTFEGSAGFSAYQWLREILPPDLPNWTRNDGKESAAPFTAYCLGQANKYWTDISRATNGCHRNIGGIKNSDFVCYPQGILSGGVVLEARQQVTFRIYNPLTGQVVMDTTTMNTGEQFSLTQGPGAYIIKGTFGPTLSDEMVLNVKHARSITIDGSANDWDLSEFTTAIRGGQGGTGDYALVGYDGGSRYYGGYWTGGVLPTSASDHRCKVYSRQNSDYLYFLVRCDDSDLWYPEGTGSNWVNDCVEFYIDPGNDGGSDAMSDSTSDVQLVIDAYNQKNIYMCTSEYAAQVLAGLTSAVTRDGTGWWLEVRITKSALDPALPAAGIFGIDFNFRDNDNDNDATQTTVYTWSDPSSGDGFPSKVPDRWAHAFIPDTNPINCADAIQQGYGIAGDLNGDCYVDLSDFSIFAGEWLKCIEPNDPACSHPW